jgi:hypothetical protein
MAHPVLFQWPDEPHHHEGKEPRMPRASAPKQRGGQDFDGGELMHQERLIDNLIEAGWHVLDTDFDETALQNWRELAHICLTDLLGSDHIYVQQFTDWVRQREKLNLMAAGGVLVAAKEVVSNMKSVGRSVP